MREFKVRPKGSIEKWEDLPVVETFPEDLDLEGILYTLRQTLENIVEIRWNFSRSMQGHYAPGNVSRYD